MALPEDETRIVMLERAFEGAGEPRTEAEVRQFVAMCRGGYTPTIRQGGIAKVLRMMGLKAWNPKTGTNWTAAELD